MQIKRFVGEKIHGYIDLTIDFFPDVNFLTGINGSGKTSVVNGISALISPSLIDLARTEYARMEVTVENNSGEDIRIWANKDTEKITIGSNRFKKATEIPILRDEVFDFTPAHAVREEQEAFYREQEAKLFDDPVIKLIKALPTPMFLDIERRLDRLYYKRPISVSSSYRRRNPNVFKLSLHRSLAEATNLAEHSFRQTKAKKDKLMEDFRKKIILSSIEFEDTSLNTPSQFPSLDSQFFKTKAKIKQTLMTLGLSEIEIDTSLDPFFSRLEDLSRSLPPGGNVAEFLSAISITELGKPSRKRKTDQSVEKLKAFMDWMVNRPQYHRIMKIKGHVDNYVQDSQRFDEPIAKYLETVNQFLNDSGKEIKFNETANLIVTFKDSDDQPITSLASGESQIVVILTHLFFNPDAKTANVFIVDEPELSLHVRWQELFVESIKTANPSLQLILATHSPSIILDDIAHCIDLSREH